jgi:superfamily II DNA or RNA helicase
MFSNEELKESFKSFTTDWLEENFYQVLSNACGFDKLSREQTEALYNIVILRRDSLLVMPTGSGKSIIAAGSAYASSNNLLSSDARAHWLTLVVVPTKVIYIYKYIYLKSNTLHFSVLVGSYLLSSDLAEKNWY